MVARILVVLMLALAGPLAAHAATLRLATVAPDGSFWMREMRAGAEEIARRTDDRVRIQFFPGGVMGNEQAVLRRIRIGQLQGGAFTGGSLSPVYRDASIYSLPFLFRSHAEVDFVRERFDAELQRGLLDAGFVSFGIAEGGFARLLSAEPVVQLGDLEGQKVWVPEGDPVAYAAMGLSAAQNATAKPSSRLANSVRPSLYSASAATAASSRFRPNVAMNVYRPPLPRIHRCSSQ